MTEEDAKTKWCPFVRMGEREQYEATSARYKQAPNCIGSACMAWHTIVQTRRWLVILDDRPEEEWSWDPRENSSFAGRVQARLSDRRHGYCGLVGRPS